MTAAEPRVRAVLGALADRAPVPPDIDAIRAARPTPVRSVRRRAAVLAGTAVVVALLGLVALRVGDDRTTLAGAPNTHRVPREVPSDLRLVNASDWEEGPLRGTSLTYTTGPPSFDEDDRAFEVHVIEGDGFGFAPGRDGREVVELTVQGRDAALIQEGSEIGVLWNDDGANVEVSAHHLSRDEVLRVAQSIEPVSDEAWRSIRR